MSRAFTEQAGGRAGPSARRRPWLDARRDLRVHLIFP
jgi:hypothetical protein